MTSTAPLGWMTSAWLHCSTAPSVSARNANGDLAPASSCKRPPLVEVGSLQDWGHGVPRFLKELSYISRLDIS